MIKNSIKKLQSYYVKQKGFVLPFTMFVSAIMLLISFSVALIFSKQMYFSNIARESQRAYYAADNAVACALSVDETYIDINGVGILPSDSTLLGGTALIDNMRDVLTYVNDHRAAMIPSKPPLAATLEDIECGQSKMFVENTVNNFTIQGLFTREIPPSDDFPLGGTEEGVTSTFTMKMNLGDGSYRCAKVTVNKTASYRQVVAQGYAHCDRPSGAVERAVVDTTIIQ